MRTYEIYQVVQRALAEGAPDKPYDRERERERVDSAYGLPDCPVGFRGPIPLGQLIAPGARLAASD